MDERLECEFALLRRQHADAERSGRWFLVPEYPLPAGWSPSVIDTAFFVRDGYPGTSPYGIYVPTGLRFNELLPDNFRDAAPNKPPFSGEWGIFSWEAEQWFPTADVVSGHNLLTWVRGFRRRFLEGK